MVGLMAATGNITGDVDQDRVHIRALKKLIDMRGGINRYKETQPAFSSLLSTGDLINAIISGSLPSLEAPDIRLNEHLSQLPGYTLHLLTSPPTSTSFRGAIDSTMQVIPELTRVQSSLSNDASTSMTSILAFMQICSAVEHYLVSLQPPDSASLLDQITRITLLLCMSTTLHSLLPFSTIVRSLQYRLKALLIQLEDSSKPLLYTWQQKKLLWILCVGGMTALPHRQNWYCVRIAALLGTLQIGDIQAAIACLEKYVWSSRMDGLAWRALWDKAWALREKWGS